MKFGSPLVKGRLIRRYKRFLADVEMASGETLTAHVANPGAMTGLADPGLEIWLSKSDNPKRKLAYSWELARIGRHLVGINAGFANRIAEEALAAGDVPGLAGYAEIRREVRYGANSRVDFLLSAPRRRDTYVEVKNVHLRRGRRAEFPDSVTARGTKHLGELARMVEEGHRAVMLYVVQRADCEDFGIAADIDPAYARALDAARKAGVEVLCHVCRVRTDGITLGGPLPIAL